MNRNFLFLLYLFFVPIVWSQDSTVDSLHIELGKAKNDTTKISLLFQLAHLHKKQNNIDSTHLYIDKGIRKCNKKVAQEAPKLIVEAMDLLTAVNRFDELISFGLKNFEILRKNDSKVELLQSAGRLGYAYYTIGQTDSSDFYESFVINNANEGIPDERKEKVQSLRKRVSMLMTEGKYHKSIENLEEASRLLDTSSYFNQYTVFVTMADAYRQLKDFDNALINLDKANTFAEKTGRTNIKIHIAYSYADFYRSIQRYDKAKEVALKGIDVAEKNNERFGLIALKSILAKLYLDTEEFEKAKPHLEFIISYGTELNAFELVSIAQYDLGKIENHNSNHQQALKLCMKSWDFFEKSPILIHKPLVCECLYEAHKGLGNYKDALTYYTQAVAYKDSVNNDEEIQKAYQLQNKFELEKKQIEFDAETEKQELITKQKLDSKNQLIQGFGIVAVLLITLTFFIFRSKQRKREVEIATQKEQAQQAFSQQLLLSQEEERVRISRDLHDSVGQDLILLKSKAQQNQNSEMENAIASTLSNVRNITQGLHPFVLEQFGLTVALKKLTELIDQSTDIFISDEIENIDGLLSKEQELGVYRITQEALNNIVKHAETPSALIVAHQKESHIILSIKDYGKGFDWTTNSKVKDSLGMKTLQERAKMLSADLDISSESNRGTTIYLKIPVKNA